MIPPILSSPRSCCLVLCFASSAAFSYGALDVDSDGFSDVWESKYGFYSGSQTADADGDGYNNLKESIWGTDPFSSSSKPGYAYTMELVYSDYYTDYSYEEWELTMSWSSQLGKVYQPRLAESYNNWYNWGSALAGTGNSMSVDDLFYEEYTYYPYYYYYYEYSNIPYDWDLNVSDVDTDGDGFTDWEELTLGTSPTTANADVDNDNILDATEMAIAGNLTTFGGGTSDVDGDGTTDYFEFLAGTLELPSGVDNAAMNAASSWIRGKYSIGTKSNWVAASHSSVNLASAALGQ